MLRKNRLQDAREICRKAWSADSRDIEAWYHYGVISAQLHDYGEAVQGFAKTCALRPDMVEAHFNLALALQMTGKLEDAADSYRRVIALRPSLPETHNNLGNVLTRLGRPAEAEACYRDALAVRADFEHAQANLASVLQQQGRHEAAEEIYRALSERQPGQPAWLIRIGQLRLASGDPDDAEAAFRRAIALDGLSHDAYRGLGEAALYRGALLDSAVCFRQALQARGDDAVCHARLGTVLSLQGELAEALACFESALALDPQLMDARIGHSAVLLRLGRIDEAESAIRRVVEAVPERVEAVIVLADACEVRGDLEEAYRLLRPLALGGEQNAYLATAFGKVCKQTGRYEEAIRYIEGLLERARLPIRQDRELHFALGALYHGIREYRTAFRHYQMANRLKHVQFDPEAHSAWVDRIIGVFTRDRMRHAGRAGNRDQRPVFIVGMPRSGTSLVEQILACHPEVHGAGELPDLYEMIMALPQADLTDTPYPECLDTLSPAVLDKLAARYLERLDGVAAGALRVTDKLPDNFLFLGMIALLFPGARVVHCQRDARDTCLSCYFQDFAGPVNYAYDLDHLGRYYRDYARLMAHWNAVLDIPILTIRYEELIDQQEAMSRKLVSFCGLEWHADCLRFHESGRHVRTASYDQVRQPIYRTSLGKAQPYRAMLTTLDAYLD
jgi:tetratricopeptide (TPR) repeat protein